jgi:mannose-6-phosphate isomerase-like protein (cupin superfamily)
MRGVHIRARDAAKQAGSARAWGFQVWMANRALSGSSLSLARIILEAGHSTDSHHHPNADEVIYSIRGRVAVHAGPETFLLEAADALAIPSALAHRIENVGTDDAELILTYSTGNRDYVAESIAKPMWIRFTDWWARPRDRSADDGTLGPPP